MTEPRKLTSEDDESWEDVYLLNGFELDFNVPCKRKTIQLTLEALA